MEVYHEKCTFEVSVPVTAQNRDLILSIVPDVPWREGDTANLKYTIDITYWGRVWDRFQAMITLGARGTSDDVLIKRVFQLYDGYRYAGLPWYKRLFYALCPKRLYWRFRPLHPSNVSANQAPCDRDCTNIGT